jgi:nitrate/nitrite-specific signal transduction histidine kinase
MERQILRLRNNTGTSRRAYSYISGRDCYVFTFEYSNAPKSTALWISTFIVLLNSFSARLTTIFDHRRVAAPCLLSAVSFFILK